MSLKQSLRQMNECNEGEREEEKKFLQAGQDETGNNDERKVITIKRKRKRKRKTPILGDSNSSKDLHRK